MRKLNNTASSPKGTALQSNLSAKQHAPTVAFVCKRFLEEHSSHHNKEGTRYDYEGLPETLIEKSQFGGPDEGD